MNNAGMLHKHGALITGIAIFSILWCWSALSPCPVNADIIEKLKVKEVALTFDACETTTPSHFDEKILSYLVKEQIPFTVFMTGKFANRNSERVKDIAKLPFVEIENHSFNHQQHMERLSADEVRKEVTDLDELMKKMGSSAESVGRFQTMGV